MTFVRARENESDYMEAYTSKRAIRNQMLSLTRAAAGGGKLWALSRCPAPRYGSPWRHRLLGPFYRAAQVAMGICTFSFFSSNLTVCIQIKRTEKFFNGVIKGNISL